MKSKNEKIKPAAVIKGIETSLDGDFFVGEKKKVEENSKFLTVLVVQYIIFYFLN